MLMLILRWPGVGANADDNVMMMIWCWCWCDDDNVLLMIMRSAWSEFWSQPRAARRRAPLAPGTCGCTTTPERIIMYYWSTFCCFDVPCFATTFYAPCFAPLVFHVLLSFAAPCFATLTLQCKTALYILNATSYSRRLANSHIRSNSTHALHVFFLSFLLSAFLFWFLALTQCDERGEAATRRYSWSCFFVLFSIGCLQLAFK